jgi:hypothetical protein
MGGEGRIHTEQPFFARLQKLFGGNSEVFGEKSSPVTGLDKTLE